MIDQLQTRLVESAISGDIESFGKLCQRYYSAMTAIGYSILTDHQLAQDAAQETFAKAIVGLNGLRDKSKFGSWLAGICRNTAKDMAAKKIRPFDFAQGGQTNTEEIPQAADSDKTGEDDQVVRQAIDRLPRATRELISLRYYSGLSYEQISSVLGISQAAVNGRLIRAKRKLAKYLKHSDLLEV